MLFLLSISNLHVGYTQISLRDIPRHFAATDALVFHSFVLLQARIATLFRSGRSIFLLRFELASCQHPHVTWMSGGIIWTFWRPRAMVTELIGFEDNSEGGYE